MIERWWVAPGAEPLLASRGLLTIDGAVAAAAAGRTLSTDRQSAAVLLAGEPPLLLKWRHVRRGRRARTLGRASHERREGEALRWAAARGVPAPAPLAVAERRRRGILVASVLVRPFLAGHATAREALAGDGGPALVPRLGEALGAWHATGFRHGNAYPKNVLVPADGGPLAAIGCPAARFVRPGPRGDRARWKDVGQMLVGVAEAMPAADPEALLAAYARGAGLPDPALVARRARPHAEGVLRKKAARLATLPEREPHGAPPPSPIAPAPPGTTVRRLPWG